MTLLPNRRRCAANRGAENPREELLIALAGPAVNVVIAVGLLLFAGENGCAALVAVESSRVAMVDRLAAVNLFIAILNIIPAFPMDGGRVLRALLAIRLGHVRATEIAASIGQVVAFALGFLGLFGNPLLIFIAIFVFTSQLPPRRSWSRCGRCRAMCRSTPR